MKVRGGQAGRVIIDEARAIRAQAIVLALPPRTGTTLFGKTVETCHRWLALVLAGVILPDAPHLPRRSPRPRA